ncbi:aminotransferase class III-fold pyridoxal phosphate-dependent enzyme [Nitrospira sp. Kam-Ns4a]
MVDPTPQLTVADAVAIARDRYGIAARAQPLPSERDQNFLLETAAGPEYVLKIANAAESRAVLEAQNAALEHVARHVPAVRCPRVRETPAGEPIITVAGPSGTSHFVRVLTYVPGHLLVEVAPHSPGLLRSVGALFGRLDLGLASFSHPALKREIPWDLRRAGSVVAANLAHLADPDRRALVERFHRRFVEAVEPALSGLRTSVIHHDGNDYNVLVTGLDRAGGEATGLLDFGDLIESCLLFEVAVCAAYALLGKTDPVFAAAQVVGGYHRVNPLSEAEMELLPALIPMRLCVSVALSAVGRQRRPDNPYLTVSEGPAWAALVRLAGISPRLLHYALRRACGLSPCPRTGAVVRWLEMHREAIGPLTEPDVRRQKPVPFDLAPSGTDLLDVPDPADPKAMRAALDRRVQEAGGGLGIGRYDEPRLIYLGEDYQPPGTEVEEWRTVHLGLDLNLAPGAPILAPLAGTVHSFRNNSAPGDYGPTVILRHEPEPGLEFFTLYGHLDRESLDGLRAGQAVAKGARIGRVGNSAVNGGWPPHLHVQLITDLLDHAGTFPGVCAERDRALWLNLCPNPNLIAQIPDVVAAPRGRSPDAVLEARRRFLGPNLRVSYERPVMLVQGARQYLYDHLGRRYLDATNNVAHVGHGHPAVVEAARRQMARLNTNTRYVHDLLVEYAERLVATLPAPLRVCYFVCSGSEANELALRLARAHTKGTDYIVVEGGYHGNTGTLVALSHYKFAGPGGDGAAPHVQTVPLPDCYRGPYREARDAGPRYASHVGEAVRRIGRAGRRVAAFLCESLPSCGGQIVPPPGYLAAAFRFVREAGGVCIADEVQVGFGRVGTHFWGFETQGVVPDIVTMGKPMGNGHPIGAVVTTPEIAASFHQGMEYFNTFGGNPVSCAVGLAVLDVIEREGLQRHALAVGAYLTDALRCLMARHPWIGDVRGTGLFLGVELVRDREMREPAGREAAYVAERLKDYGVLVGTDGLAHNVLKIKPPMCFTKGDADWLTAALDRVLSEPRLRALRAER